MFLTPVRELTISTNSDECEIVSNNICHYNVGQHFNFESNKDLYIAVKDVKVPLVEKQISFAVCYSRGNTCAESMFVKCQIAYNGLEDLALLLARKANNQIKDAVATMEFLRIRYENERFHINVPIGFCLALSANVCKLLGLHEELYNLCSSETKELVSEGWCCKKRYKKCCV